MSVNWSFLLPGCFFSKDVHRYSLCNGLTDLSVSPNMIMGEKSLPLLGVKARLCNPHSFGELCTQVYMLEGQRYNKRNAVQLLFNTLAAIVDLTYSMEQSPS
jgi:hypothetical protein